MKRRRRRDDPTPLPDGRHAAVVGWLWLARSRAGWYARRMPWLRRELESAACLGLVKAGRIDFDETGAATRRVFLQTYIDGEIRAMIARERKRADRLPMEPLQADPLGMGSDRLDSIVDFRRDTLAAVDDRDEAERILSRLPRDVAEALRLICIEGLSQSEAGRRMGCSQNRVCRLVAETRITMSALSPRA